MATKTKEAKACPLDNSPELQKAIRQVGIAQVRITAYLTPPEGPTSCILQAQTALFAAASHLRRLLEASKRGRAPHRRKGAKPAKRSNVDGKLQKLPRVHSRPPKARTRKRVARKQAGKDKHSE